MTTDDSFMQIVRERLKKHNFLESDNKPGLFYRKHVLEGIKYYVDMRKQPIQMYGYRDIRGADQRIDREEVNETLKEVRRDLVSIGCDLSAFGIGKALKDKIHIVCPKCKYEWEE